MKMADKENQQKGQCSGRGLGDWESGVGDREQLGQTFVAESRYFVIFARRTNIFDFPVTNHHFFEFL